MSQGVNRQFEILYVHLYTICIFRYAFNVTFQILISAVL